MTSGLFLSWNASAFLQLQWPAKFASENAFVEFGLNVFGEASTLWQRLFRGAVYQKVEGDDWCCTPGRAETSFDRYYKKFSTDEEKEKLKAHLMRVDISEDDLKTSKITVQTMVGINGLVKDLVERRDKQGRRIPLAVLALQEVVNQPRPCSTLAAGKNEEDDVPLKRIAASANNSDSGALRDALVEKGYILVDSGSEIFSNNFHKNPWRFKYDEGVPLGVRNASDVDTVKEDIDTVTDFGSTKYAVEFLKKKMNLKDASLGGEDLEYVESEPVANNARVGIVYNIAVMGKHSQRCEGECDPRDPGKDGGTQHGRPFLALYFPNVNTVVVNVHFPRVADQDFHGLQKLTKEDYQTVLNNCILTRVKTAMGFPESDSPNFNLVLLGDFNDELHSMTESRPGDGESITVSLNGTAETELELFGRQKRRRVIREESEEDSNPALKTAERLSKEQFKLEGGTAPAPVVVGNEASYGEELYRYSMFVDLIFHSPGMAPSIDEVGGSQNQIGGIVPLTNPNAELQKLLDSPEYRSSVENNVNMGSEIPVTVGSPLNWLSRHEIDALKQYLVHNPEKLGYAFNSDHAPVFMVLKLEKAL